MGIHGEVVIVGAGLAGLCAARVLNKAHVSCTVFDAADEIGGRVRTDTVRGFLLDRGFQVYLSSYPEGRDLLFYESLGLHAFDAGAIVRVNGKFTSFADPFRHPARTFSAALSSVGSMADKSRAALLRRKLKRMPIEQLTARPEQSTAGLLRELGFSTRMIERLFRPFCGGVFLEDTLDTSSRMFEFLFRMFATGAATLPEAGMGAIPRHISARLRESEIRLNSKVVRADENGVTLAGGQRIMSRAVIVATDQTAAAEITGESIDRGWRGVTCFYFAADKPPISGKLLMLNGEARGPINHLAVVNNVCRSYAPPGGHLISASVPGGREPEGGAAHASVVDQLARWFGEPARRWELLRVYHIPQALPDQSPPALSPWQRPVRIRRGLYICGDHVDQASINGAMTSGRRAAEAVLDDFGINPAWASATGG